MVQQFTLGRSLRSWPQLTAALHCPANAAVASVHIPFIMDGNAATTFRGQQYIDGGWAWEGGVLRAAVVWGGFKLLTCVLPVLPRCAATPPPQHSMTNLPLPPRPSPRLAVGLCDGCQLRPDQLRRRRLRYRLRECLRAGLLHACSTHRPVQPPPPGPGGCETNSRGRAWLQSLCKVPCEARQLHCPPAFSSRPALACSPPPALPNPLPSHSSTMTSCSGAASTASSCATCRRCGPLPPATAAVPGCRVAALPLQLACTCLNC